MRQIKKCLLFVIVVFTLFSLSKQPVFANQNTKTYSITDVISGLPNVAQCITSCPLLDLGCYAKCAQNIIQIPSAPSSSIPSFPNGIDVAPCLQGCLSNPSPNCLTGCIQNLPVPQAQCVMTCGLDPNCLLNQCQQNVSTPPNQPIVPPPDNNQPPPVQNPLPDTPPQSPCEQDEGYCTRDTICDPGYVYNNQIKGCPKPPNDLQWSCCELKPESPEIPPVLPGPNIPGDENGVFMSGYVTMRNITVSTSPISITATTTKNDGRQETFYAQIKSPQPNINYPFTIKDLVPNLEYRVTASVYAPKGGSPIGISDTIRITPPNNNVILVIQPISAVGERLRPAETFLIGSSNEVFSTAIDKWGKGEIGTLEVSSFIKQLTRAPGLQIVTCDLISHSCDNL